MEVTFDATHRRGPAFNASCHLPFPALGFAFFHQEIQKCHLGALVLSPSSVFSWWVDPGPHPVTCSLPPPAAWGRESEEQKQEDALLEIKTT